MVETYLNGEWDELSTTKPSKFRVVNMGNARFPTHQPVRWSGRLPRRTCTLLAGDGGIGKTTLTALIAACLTTGQPLPGEAEGEEPQAVLVLAFEDNFEGFWLPRFRAHNGDEKLLNRVELADDDVFTVYDIPALKSYSEYGLIILDPVAEVVSNSLMDPNKAEAAKAVMGGMREVAFATGASTLCLAHFGKATDRTLGNQISGSAQWRQSARSALLFGELADGTLGLLHNKANSSKLQDPLEFVMDETVAELQGETMTTAVLRFKSVNPDITHFFQKIAGPQDDDGSMKKHAYAQWVVKQLDITTGGKAKATDLEALFIQQHNRINPACFQVGVRCAKDNCGVYAYVDGGHMMLANKRPQGVVLTNENGDVL